MWSNDPKPNTLSSFTRDICHYSLGCSELKEDVEETCKPMVMLNTDKGSVIRPFAFGSVTLKYDVTYGEMVPHRKI